MGYWSWMCVRTSSKYGKCSRMEGGRYAPMSGVRLLLATTSQLTTFGPWKRVDLTLHPFGRSYTTRPAPPCAQPASAVIVGNYTTS